MNKTNIPWADRTWNPITGCTKGCEYCYARAIAKRFNRIIPEDGEPVRGGSARAIFGDRPAVYAGEGETFPFAFDPTMYEHRLAEPLKLKKPARIFLGSMGDIFDPTFPDDFIDRVLNVAWRQAPWHTYLLLTKQPQRMREYITREWAVDGVPLPNLWLGVTVTNQADADERIPLLLGTPAAHRFVSVEPMLGPVDLSDYVWEHDERDYGVGGGRDHLDLVIAGAKTPGKPLHEQAAIGKAWKSQDDRPTWLRSLRDQCLDAGVDFHYKHQGTNPALDGVVHDAMPGGDA